MIDEMKLLPDLLPATTKASLAVSVGATFNDVQEWNNLRSEYWRRGKPNSTFRNVIQFCHVLKSLKSGLKIAFEKQAWTIFTVSAPTGVK